MIGAFIVLCLVFNVFTEGRFLTPRNIFNLTIQTVSVAIMATGMVFVIVTRHIDLSVGSVLATVFGRDGDDQTDILPQWLGLGLGHRRSGRWPSSGCRRVPSAPFRAG
jgi:D-xylose transport system permease protein